MAIETQIKMENIIEKKGNLNEMLRGLCINLESIINYEAVIQEAEKEQEQSGENRVGRGIYATEKGEVNYK